MASSAFILARQIQRSNASRIHMESGKKNAVRSRTRVVKRKKRKCIKLWTRAYHRNFLIYIIIHFGVIKYQWSAGAQHTKALVIRVFFATLLQRPQRFLSFLCLFARAKNPCNPISATVRFFLSRPARPALKLPLNRIYRCF